MMFANPVRFVLAVAVAGVSTIIGCGGVDPDNPGSGSISIKKESLKATELKKKASSSKTGVRSKRK